MEFDAYPMREGQASGCAVNEAWLWPIEAAHDYEEYRSSAKDYMRTIRSRCSSWVDRPAPKRSIFCM